MMEVVHETATTTPLRGLELGRDRVMDPARVRSQMAPNAMTFGVLVLGRDARGMRCLYLYTALQTIRREVREDIRGAYVIMMIMSTIKSVAHVTASSPEMNASSGSKHDGSGAYEGIWLR